MTKTEDKRKRNPTKDWVKRQRTRVYAIVYGTVTGGNKKTHDTHFGGPSLNPYRRHHSSEDHLGNRELLKNLIDDCEFSDVEQIVLWEHHDRLCKKQRKQQNAEPAE